MALMSRFVAVSAVARFHRVAVAGFLGIIVGVGVPGCGDSPTEPTPVPVDAVDGSEGIRYTGSDRPTLITQGVVVTGELVEMDTGDPVKGRRVAVRRGDDHFTIPCEGEELANTRTNDAGEFELTLLHKQGEPFDPRELYGTEPHLDVEADTKDYTTNGTCEPLKDDLYREEKVPASGPILNKDIEVNLGRIELEKFDFDYVFEGTAKVTYESGSVHDLNPGMKVTVRIVEGPDGSMDPNLEKYVGETYDVLNGEWEIKVTDMGHEPFVIYFEARDEAGKYYSSSHYAAPGAQDRHPQQPNPAFTRRYSPVPSRGGGRLPAPRRAAESGISNIKEELDTAPIQVPPLVLVHNFPIEISEAPRRVVSNDSEGCGNAWTAKGSLNRDAVVDEFWDEAPREESILAKDNVEISYSGSDSFTVQGTDAQNQDKARIYWADPLSGERVLAVSVVCEC